MSVLRYNTNFKSKDLANAVRLVAINNIYCNHFGYNYIFCSVAPTRNTRGGGAYVVHPRLFFARFV